MGPDQVRKDSFPIHEDITRIEGFVSTDWLDATLSNLENLQPGESTEITIPTNIDIRFFIAILGKPARNHEFGGVFNPSSRSMIVVRGYGASERGGFHPPQTPFVRPRLNPDGTDCTDG